MTPPSLVTAASVREYLGLNTSSTDSRYSDATIGSNIRSAGAFLERRTGRLFGDQTLTLKFTTNGQALIPLPGLRTATSVTLDGSTLAADSTYYLVPDVQQTGIYTAIQFRAFQTNASRGPWYLGNSEWFDRGLDLPYGGGQFTSLPNDLVIVGSWGYTDALLPEEARHVCKVLAAYYTKRPDALLSGGLTTEGGSFDLSAYPIEVQDFVRDWAVGSFVTAVG
jgi:hypothetical protein